jgi:hypothetical protein
MATVAVLLPDGDGDAGAQLAAVLPGDLGAGW